jgi:hypothetical protein
MIILCLQTFSDILQIICSLSYRWLGMTDPLRRAGDTAGPPAPRTHCKACAEAKLSESKPYHTWDTKTHIRYTTGINHWCPLSVLYMFDMIWDFCPDMMHIIKTFWERLVLGVFSGERKPNFSAKEPAKPKGTPTDDVRKAYQAKRRKYHEAQQEWARDCKDFESCLFSEADRKLVDQRVQNLVGYPYWIRNSMV